MAGVPRRQLVVLPEHVPQPLDEVPQRHPELGRPGARPHQAFAQAVDRVRIQVAGDQVALEDGHHADQGLGIPPPERVRSRLVVDHVSSR